MEITHKSLNISAHLTYTKHPEKKNFYMHTHEHCELYCFLSGKGIYKIEGNDYPLESGDILIMRPTEAHYISIDENYPYKRFVVNFSLDIFDAFDDEGLLRLPFTKRQSGKNNLYRAYDFKTEDYKVYLKNMIEHFDSKLYLTSNLFPLLNEISVAFSSKTAEKTNDTLDSKIVKYINQKICYDISLDEICKNFYISKPQLCRIFKNATGSTVWNYISVKRLALAKNLISNGMHPTKVYFECGFKDYSSFYRAYIKKYGTSPSEMSRKL